MHWSWSDELRVYMGVEHSEGWEPGGAVIWRATVARDTGDPEVWWLQSERGERSSHETAEAAMRAGDGLHDAGQLDTPIP